MKPNIYFQTTNDCNLKCAHCFQDSGPSKKHTTISINNFQKVINNLPKQRVKLTLTGGEIFKDIQNLWNYLKIIKGGEYSRIYEIEVQTNGSWGSKKEPEIENILEKLKSFGVSGLDITSSDKYHFQSGLKRSSLKNIKKVNDWKKSIPKIGIRGAREENKIFPKGRGKNVSDKDNYHVNYYDCKNVFEKMTPSLDAKGNVYMCCYNLYQLPGNIILEPLEKIIANAKNDNILKSLNDEGIKKVAKLQGMKKMEIKRIVKKHGECGLCAKLNDLF